VQEGVTALSDDELCRLEIPKDTICRKANGVAPHELTIESMEESEIPSPPTEDSHIIGLAYDFGPDGVTFDTPVTLEYEYDPEDIPDGINEEDLVMAYYDESTGEWVELVCTVDTQDDTITALVEHFTTFAIIAFETAEEAIAAIEVTGLTITPQEVASGEPVNISVAVTNTGESSESYTIYVMINGVRELRKTLSLGPGESQQADFTVVKSEAGNYSVSVGGLSGSFTVTSSSIPTAPETPPVSGRPSIPEKEPPPAETPAQEILPPQPDDTGSTNWALIGGIAVGVLVIALIITAAGSRRRS
jgi:hypothetical protein